MKSQPSSSFKQAWICDISNKKFSYLKQSFLTSLSQQSKDNKIGYYDFLLVAKKLSFRFEQSSHLMALKNYFNKNKNSVQCKKLADYLCINEQSLNTLLDNNNNTINNKNKQEKIIVKFNVPDVQFAPIKEETLEDEDQYDQNDDENINNFQNGSNIENSDSSRQFQKLGSAISSQHQKQLMQKMAIILSIKVQQMQKKLTHLLFPLQPSQPSLLSYFSSSFQPSEPISYQIFKKSIIQIISSKKQKLKLSEDDVKTIYHCMDINKNGYIKAEQIKKCLNNNESLDGFIDKMKEFYQQRLNKEMVKNTLFKLGKVKNNSIQIYQLKNASLLEFKQMEDAILNQPMKRNGFNVRNNSNSKEKSRIPHFGPLKGAAKWKKQQELLKMNNNKSKDKNLYSNLDDRSRSQPATYTQPYGITHPFPQSSNPNTFSINKQRQKIQKILRQSKDQSSLVNNVKSSNNETIASKLRSLFIHKVILPREKMLEQEKEKFIKTKLPDQQLFIKPYK